MTCLWRSQEPLLPVKVRKESFISQVFKWDNKKLPGSQPFFGNWWLLLDISVKNWMGPYQRTPKEVARVPRYSGLGVHSVGPVGDFLEYYCNFLWDMMVWQFPFRKQKTGMVRAFGLTRSHVLGGSSQFHEWPFVMNHLQVLGWSSKWVPLMLLGFPCWLLNGDTGRTPTFKKTPSTLMIQVPTDCIISTRGFGNFEKIKSLKTAT